MPALELFDVDPEMVKMNSIMRDRKLTCPIETLTARVKGGWLRICVTRLEAADAKGWLLTVGFAKQTRGAPGGRMPSDAEIQGIIRQLFIRKVNFPIHFREDVASRELGLCIRVFAAPD